jgi:type I restriction enzyme S subunit
VLLERIKAEKQQLIKDKKIKAEKPLPPITVEEIPFEIPESWVWVRLGEVVNQIADIDHKMPEKVTDGVPFISPRDFYGKNEINFDNAQKISIESFERLSKKIKPIKHDIIFPRYGTIGVCRYIDFEKPFLVSYSCVTLNTNKNLTVPKYIFYYCMSSIAKSEIEKYTVKTTQPNVGIASIGQFLIPFPPLSEQQRIVAKVEEVLGVCEGLK